MGLFTDKNFVFGIYFRVVLNDNVCAVSVIFLMFLRSFGSFLVTIPCLKSSMNKTLTFIFIFPITERATDGGLASEDWALNLEICDIINETDEGLVLSKNFHVSVFIVKMSFYDDLIADWKPLIAQ